MPVDLFFDQLFFLPYYNFVIMGNDVFVMVSIFVYLGHKLALPVLKLQLVPQKERRKKTG